MAVMTSLTQIHEESDQLGLSAYKRIRDEFVPDFF